MASVKFKIHPLFIIFGLYYAINNQLLCFIIYTLSALLHELGHSFISASKGFYASKICLMPYGAIMVTDSFGMSVFDQIKVAMAGPLTNLCISIFFVATWWLFPITYPFTESIVQANFELFIVNLLPLHGLDGGRILSCIILHAFGERAKNIVNKTSGIVGSIVFVAIFILTIKSGVNISSLLFALFLIVSLFDKNSQGKYLRIYLTLNNSALKKGVRCVKTAISADVPLKKLFSVLKNDCINEVDVYKNGVKIYSLSQNELCNLMERGNLYKSVYFNIGLQKLKD